MPRELKKIVFVMEEFAVPSPAQQLLDRFLIGYPRDGAFHKVAGVRVAAHLVPGADTAELQRRVKDFGLTIEESAAGAVKDADAVVMVWRGAGATANEGLLQGALNSAPPGAAVFVHGVLAGGFEQAQITAGLAKARKLTLLAGTPLGVTWRLPELSVPRNAGIKHAVAVVQGPGPDALFDGLECLQPLIEGQRGVGNAIRRIRHLEGADIWQAGEQQGWPWPLLAAAIARSNSPQGDPVKDGRTQDLVGLGLVPSLAKAPHAWLIEFADGARADVFSLEGVVGDYNVALQTRDNLIYSTQIYRAPAPSQHHFSELAAVLEKYFRSGAAPWRPERNILQAGILQAFASIPGGKSEWNATPNLKLR